MLFFFYHFFALSFILLFYFLLLLLCIVCTFSISTYLQYFQITFEIYLVDRKCGKILCYEWAKSQKMGFLLQFIQDPEKISTWVGIEIGVLSNTSRKLYQMDYP